MKPNNGRLLRVGIAGYGVVGKRRRKYIDLHPNMLVTAVCDQKFNGSGIMQNGVRYHANYQQLLGEPLDVIFVSLPNFIAAEVTIAGLKSGLHVFCEKPPGCTVAEIEQVIRVEKAHGDLYLKYGFNHRYHDSVQEAMRIVQSGELGEVINLRGVYGKSKIIPFEGGWRAERKYAGGGILLDQGIHMVDLIRLFCGEFVEVKSFISNDYWKHDVEDNAHALLKDEMGRIAMLHSSATQWQHRFVLDIALTEGFMELRGILSGSKSYGQETLVVGKRDESDMGTQRQETLTYLQDNSWKREIIEFADAILNKNPIPSGNSRDALEVMKTVFRIYHADESWRNAYQTADPVVGGDRSR